MKSLRLDPELEDRLERAAELSGMTLSEFIRQAAAERADAVLRSRPDGIFADIAGVIHGGGEGSRRTGDVFAELLAERERERKRKRSA